MLFRTVKANFVYFKHFQHPIGEIWMAQILKIYVNVNPYDSNCIYRVCGIFPW